MTLAESLGTAISTRGWLCGAPQKQVYISSAGSSGLSWVQSGEGFGGFLVTLLFISNF